MSTKLGDRTTSEPINMAMTSKIRLIGLGAIVSVAVSTALLALSFVTHSIWPIIPGVYAVAWVVGIHNASILGSTLVNTILLWILVTSALALYRWRYGR